MKTVVIGWRERLDDLYFIAENCDVNAEQADDEWWDSWRPEKAGPHDDVIVEPIPDGEWSEFCSYANDLC